MEIHHLKIFLSVFRNRSFSKASVELHLAQPTISEHVKSLERELNCALFERLGKKIIPTREAEVLGHSIIDNGFVAAILAEPARLAKVSGTQVPTTSTTPQ